MYHIRNFTKYVKNSSRVAHNSVNRKTRHFSITKYVVSMPKISTRTFGNYSYHNSDVKNSRHEESSPSTKIDIHSYPCPKFNTILNVCPEGQRMVVETLGRYSTIHQSGWFFALPFFQKIKYVVDTRELVISVNPQYAHTLDNVEIAIAAQLYLQCVDSYKVCYNIRDPLVAVVSHTQSAMRTSVGKTDLDHLLKDRTSINSDVNIALQNAEENWGIRVKRVEITQLTPDSKIAHAMDLQATAERERRQTEKNAEAKKKAMELEAAGYKEKLILEAEGNKQKAILEAEGKAESLRVETEAQVKSMEIMSVGGLSNADVLKFQTTLRYINAMFALCQSGKHSTLFMGKDMSSVGALTKNILNFTTSNEKPTSNEKL